MHDVWTALSYTRPLILREPVVISTRRQSTSSSQLSSTVVLGVLRSGMKPFTPISRRACETFEKLTDRSGSRPLDQRVFRLGIYIVAGYTFRHRDPTAHKCNSTYQDYSRLYETTCSRGNPIRLTYPKTGGCVFFGCLQHPKRAKVSRDHLVLYCTHVATGGCSRQRFFNRAHR